MGMNLRSELEPLLAKLWDSAEGRYKDGLGLNPADPGDKPKIDNLVAEFSSELSSLVSRFQSYYTLDDYNLDPLAEQFADPSDRWETAWGGSAYCCIARAEGDVGDVLELIDADLWTGQAAKAFRTNFLVPFKKTAIIHGQCVREMATAAQALAQAVELAKEYLVWICKSAAGVVTGPRPGEKEEANLAAWGAILTDAVALFKALVAPEIELVDVGLAAGAVSLGLIGESKGGSDEIPINVDWGPDFDAVEVMIHSTWDALNQLDRNIAETDDKISRGLEKDLSSGAFQMTAAKMADPDLRPSAYRELARPQAKYLDHGDDVVVKSFVKLFYAGSTMLPQAAALYDTGAKACAGVHIAGVDKQFPRAVSALNEAAETLGKRLTEVRDELTHSGESMVTAAQDLQSVDSYEAQRIQLYETQIADPYSYRSLPSFLQAS